MSSAIDAVPESPAAPVPAPAGADRLLSLIADLACVVGPDGHFHRVNAAFERALGWSRDELLARPILDFVHPDDRARTAAAVPLAGARPVPDFESRFRCRDGSYRWLSWRSSEPDDLGFAYGIARDVTADRRDREQIRFQAALLDAVGQAVVATEPDGTIRYWGRGAEALYGWPAAEVLGRPIAEVMVPAATREQGESIMAELRAGASWTGEFEVMTRDGTPVPVLTADTPVCDADGSLVAIVGTAADLRPLKLADERLRQSERRFRTIMELSSDIVAVLDASARIVYASPSYEHGLGYAPDDVLGGSIFDLVHGDDRAAAEAAFADVVRRPGGTTSVQLRARRRDGEWRVFEVAARNVLDDPAVGGVVISGRDLTERQRLEAQLRQAQKMEAVGQLAGGVSHDFNNLLTVIAAHAEFLGMGLAEDAPEREDVVAIRRAAERAAGLTRQLLAFSRQQLLAPRVVEPNDVIGDVERMLRRVIGEDIELAVSLAPDAGPVLVDPGQLEQVLLNLALNARDAMPNGGALTIESRPVPAGAPELARSPDVGTGAHVMLVVRDTGDGIAPANLGRIFEPFFTTKEVGRGTGLGLATAYGIVRQSGGAIGVESEPGVGTTFTILLPVAAEPAPEPTEPAARDWPAADAPTVLVVEDEAAVRAIARRILAEQGYQVLEARDGAEALAVLDADPEAAQLVLTDAVMPRLGGPGLVAALRERCNGVPVVLMSGYTEDHPARSGSPTTGTTFLPKPFTGHALRRAVRDALGGRTPRVTARPG